MSEPVRQVRLHEQHRSCRDAVEIGLCELRLRARDVVRRAEAGETITVTASGRPAARRVPPEPDPWRRYEDVARISADPTDPACQQDQALVDQVPLDPCSQPWRWPST